MHRCEQLGIQCPAFDFSAAEILVDFLRYQEVMQLCHQQYRCCTLAISSYYKFLVTIQLKKTEKST